MGYEATTVNPPLMCFLPNRDVKKVLSNRKEVKQLSNELMIHLVRLPYSVQGHEPSLSDNCFVFSEQEERQKGCHY